MHGRTEQDKVYRIATPGGKTHCTMQTTYSKSTSLCAMGDIAIPSESAAAIEIDPPETDAPAAQIDLKLDSMEIN